MLEVLDDAVFVEPLFSLFNPILIVKRSWTWMWNELAVDRVGDQFLFLKLLDTIVSVSTNTDNDLRMKDFNSKLKVLESSDMQLRLCFAL